MILIVTNHRFAVTVQCTVRKPIDFGEIDEHIFIYNREAQRLLNTILLQRVSTILEME